MIVLFNFQDLIKKHSLDIKGVLHVGAHECGEIYDYALAGIKYAVLVEANPERAKNLQNSIRTGVYAKSCWPYVNYEKLPPELAEITKGYIVYNYAVYSEDGVMLDFNISNFDGGTDSIYKINDFGKKSSWVPYSHITSIKMKSVTLDNMLRYNLGPIELMNIDVEGAEIDVFKGALDILKSRVKYVMVETQDKHRFDNSCLKPEVTRFLSAFGFKEIDYSDTGKEWGDTLYAKV